MSHIPTPPDAPVSTGTSSEPSLGTLVRQLSEESSRLVRSELQLARAEMIEKAKGIGKGAGILSAGGVVALFGVGALIATLILVLDLFLPAWLAALIVTIVLFVIAGVAALVGKKKLQEAAPPKPDRAVANIKQDINEIKDSAHR